MVSCFGKYCFKNAMDNLKTKVVNNLGLTISDFALFFHLTNKPN
jgi:hypothetical protein